MRLLAHVQLEDFLPTVMETLADPRVFGFEQAAIFRLDQEHSTFIREVSHGYSLGRENMVQRITEGVLGRAVRENRTVYVPDVTKDPDYLPGALAIGSEVALPLVIRREDAEVVIGVLDVERSEAHAFSAFELVVLELFVEQVATYYGLLEALQHDQTTSALSVATLAPLLGTLVQDYRRSGRPGVVIFADVNGLHAMNERYGHEVGSASLRHFVTTIRATLREGDLVIRFGGDEFLILLHDATDGAVLSRIAEALEVPIPPTSLPPRTHESVMVTGAFGVISLATFFRRHPELLDDHDLSRCLSVLRTEASRTMLRSKEPHSREKISNHCVVAYYEDLDEEVEERIRLRD